MWLLVHSYSDGMGRSGVFICAMSEVERVKVEGQVDVFQAIKGMRIQRPHMVDTLVCRALTFYAYNILLQAVYYSH